MQAAIVRLHVSRRAVHEMALTGSYSVGRQDRKLRVAACRDRSCFIPGVIAPSAATLRAYRLSRYVAGSMVIFVGAYPQGTPVGATQTTLVLLGACNPGGRRHPDGWNARMMDRLRSVLHRFHYIEAKGSLDRWSEEMLMVAIDPRQARVIARRFRQNAIILIAGRRRTRLIIIAEKIPNIAECIFLSR